MSIRRPRANVTFRPESFERLESLSAKTGLPISHIVDQLIGGHLQEMTEFERWLDGQNGEARARGIHALAAYGPNDLITEMKRLDPTYQPPEARVLVAGAGVLADDELTDLRAMLNEWRAKQ